MTVFLRNRLKFIEYVKYTCLIWQNPEAGKTGVVMPSLSLVPQVNSYRDLVEEIKKADETQADP